MRVWFVLSALSWSCLVGRFIAFGPTVYGWCWWPQFDADSWYRLTPIPYKIHHKMFVCIPWVLCMCTLPALFIFDDFKNTVTCVVLASEQAFVPIFVAQIHSPISLIGWSLANILGNILVLILFLAHPFGIVTCIGLSIKCMLHIWFTYIELYIYRGNIIREPPTDDGRQTRVMTV